MECMAGVKRFQDLDCWKLARMVRREVVRLTRREPVCRDFKFVNQIRDAARGGTRNIAEGWSRFGPAEIVYFLGIAKASLDETEDEMLDGFESGYWTRQEYNVVRSYLRRTHGAIRGWWRYLESPEAHPVPRRSQGANRTRNPARPAPLAQRPRLTPLAPPGKARARETESRRTLNLNLNLNHEPRTANREPEEPSTRRTCRTRRTRRTRPTRISPQELI
jgi:four helix bundle protein